MKAAASHNAALSHAAIYLSAAAAAHFQHAERDCALERLSSVLMMDKLRLQTSLILRA